VVKAPQYRPRALVAVASTTHHGTRSVRPWHRAPPARVSRLAPIYPPSLPPTPPCRKLPGHPRMDRVVVPVMSAICLTLRTSGNESKSVVAIIAHHVSSHHESTNSRVRHLPSGYYPLVPCIRDGLSRYSTLWGEKPPVILQTPSCSITLLIALKPGNSTLR
jgi:hypothetical protein